MIFRLLHFLFPSAYRKAVFESQRKPKDFSKLEFCFVDSNGKTYYRYSDDLDIPISRKGYFEQCFMEFDAAISHKELTLVLDAMSSAINKKDKKGRMEPDIAMVGHLINEVKNRKESLIHPEIMFDMAAALYIREDEEPGKVDKELHRQKVDQFKKDSQGGLYDFFYTAGLSRYIPFSKLSAKEFEMIMRLSRVRMEALTQQIEKYFSEKES